MMSILQFQLSSCVIIKPPAVNQNRTISTYFQRKEEERLVLFLHYFSGLVNSKNTVIILPVNIIKCRQLTYDAHISIIDNYKTLSKEF